MLEICALASGSNGNCYYIGNDTEAILIDAGIFYKRLVERLDDADLDISKIKAIFISHEHADHVQGVRVCCKKLNVPVYFNQKTFKNLPHKNQPQYVSYFEPEIPQSIGSLIITPFRKMHDAADACSFTVECQGKNIGVMTDIGIANESVQNEFSKCHAVFLETNYDKEMLWQGFYPERIKHRVDSDHGHLSNIQALELVKNCASADLKHIFLSHISKDNNTIELALQTFAEFNGRYRLIPTSREGISEVLRF